MYLSVWNGEWYAYEYAVWLFDEDNSKCGMNIVVWIKTVPDLHFAKQWHIIELGHNG